MLPPSKLIQPYLLSLMQRGSGSTWDRQGALKPQQGRRNSCTAEVLWEKERLQGAESVPH